MIVPYKPVYFQKATKKFRYIIIHDLSCRFSKVDGTKTDTNKISSSYLRSVNWVFNDEFDMPFHFLCEKVGKDFETIMGTPFCYRCIYDDIPSQYDASIHIALGGNFSVIQPSTRSYQQIGFRSIASIMRWFRIPFGHIHLHREISTDKENACPGKLFDKNRFMSAIKPMVLFKG